MMTRRTAAAAVGFCVAIAGRVAAQIDYRNLDDERPIATEDAYPVERYAFEVVLPYHLDRERGGERRHRVPFTITYGMDDNTALGIETPIAVVERAGGAGTEWGLAGLTLFALHNFNTESPFLPALSLRTDLYLPAGALGGERGRFSLKAIATRSWGRYRIHGNAVRSVGADGASDALPRWRYSVAADRTFFRHSMLLVSEVAAARSASGAPVEINVSVGTRYQWSPTFVIDVGLSRRLRTTGPDYGFGVGLSHVFGLRWLMPGAR